MAMNLRPRGTGGVGMISGPTPGMPPGFANLINEKYRQSGQVAAAQAAQGNANAALTRQQANQYVAESLAKIRESGANADLTKQKADVVKPLADSDIRKNDAWIYNTGRTTDANVRQTNASSQAQEIQNRYLPRQEGLKTLSMENKVMYEPELMRAEAGRMRAQSRGMDAETLGQDEDNRAKGRANDEGFLRPQSQLQYAPAPQSTLAEVLNSMGSATSNVWAGAGPTPMAPVGGVSFNFGGGGAGPSPIMAPVLADAGSVFAPAPIRRASTGSLFADAGGSSLLDGSFLNNRLTLKRGTAKVPGKGEGDKVPAMLEPGEAVLNKHAAGMIGREKIAAANAKGNQKRQGEALRKVAALVKSLGMG